VPAAASNCRTGRSAISGTLVVQVVTRGLKLIDIRHPEQEERKLDEVINKLENMDEDDFEALRQKRLQKMKRQQQLKAEWTLLGHGRWDTVAYSS
jgi:predicted GTPase